MLTKKEQLLLLEILLKGKIKRNTQKVYVSRWGFWNSIKNLQDKDLIDSKQCKNSNEKFYFLTFKGFVRSNLIALDENNGNKYNQIKNPDIISILRGYQKWVG